MDIFLNCDLEFAFGKNIFFAATKIFLTPKNIQPSATPHHNTKNNGRRDEDDHEGTPNLKNRNERAKTRHPESSRQYQRELVSSKTLYKIFKVRKMLIWGEMQIWSLKIFFANVSPGSRFTWLIKKMSSISAIVCETCKGKGMVLHGSQWCGTEPFYRNCPMGCVAVGMRVIIPECDYCHGKGNCTMCLILVDHTKPKPTDTVDERFFIGGSPF